MGLQLKSVYELENAMRKMPQAEGLVTTHYFAHGLYARSLFRPKGTLISGKVHKQEHLYIVCKGKVQIGKQVYEAGTVLVSVPGTKRQVLALEDSICMTVHHTFKKNLKRMERDLVQPDELALFDASNKLKELPCLG